MVNGYDKIVLAKYIPKLITNKLLVKVYLTSQFRALFQNF